MKTCLTYQSAWEYWFRSAVFHKRKPRAILAMPEFDPPSGPEWNAVLAECEELGFSLPLHVLVQREVDKRCRNGTRVVHCLTKPLQSDAFRQIGRGLVVESPEMLFVDMATKMPFVRLIQFGCELCGTLALDSNAVGGVVYREQIADPNRMRSFIERSFGMYGTAKARRALEFIIPGAWSPMEVTTALLLCLPPRYGGYSLPRPELNRRIDPKQSDKQVVRCGYRRGDLVWEYKGHHLVVEYDSKDAHDDKYDQDRRRVGELNYMGYEVISVTPRMLYNFDAMEQVALRVARSLGIAIRKEYLGYSSQRAALRRELLR